MGFPEFVIVIASIMALNPLAMDMMLPALPNIGSAFAIPNANHPQMVLSIFLIGFGAGQFVMGPCRTVSAAARCCSAAWRSMRCQPAGDRRALVRDAAAGARAARRWDVGNARHRHFDRSRLLCRPPDGERDVARHDGFHRRARDCAFVRSGGDAGHAIAGIFVDVMIYGVLALVWSVVRLPEPFPFPNAGRWARRRARRLPPDRDRPPDLRYAMAAGSVIGVLFAYVFSSQQLFTEIYHLGHYFPIAFAAIATVRGRGISQCQAGRPPRHAHDFARRADRIHGHWRRHTRCGKISDAAAGPVHGALCP